ncbi:MAG: hypothetical protein FVQ85_19115 [Planctomycetes bacterium]|nr:hypothetical protein [Planctomycetota bacterium]
MHKLYEIPFITLFLFAFRTFLWLKNPFNQRNPRLMNYLRAYKTRSTTVEDSLQICSLIMQNEPNLPDTQMNVTTTITKDYGNETLSGLGKNEPKTNPIKANTNPIKANIMPKQTQYEPKQTQFHTNLGVLKLVSTSRMIKSFLNIFGSPCVNVGKTGEYQVQYGPIQRNTSKTHLKPRPTIERFILQERAGRYELDIPSRREIVIKFQLVNALKRQEPLPDPAICTADIMIVNANEKHATFKLTVHNLGNAPVRELPVVIMGSFQGKKRVLARTVIDLLPESKDMRSSKVSITLNKITLSPGLKAIIDPDRKIEEICESNNEASISCKEG